MIGGSGDEGRDGAEGVGAIKDVDKTFFCVLGRAATSGEALGDGADVVHEGAVSNRDIGIAVQANGNGAGSEGVVLGRVPHGYGGVNGCSPFEGGGRVRIILQVRFGVRVGVAG